MIALISDKLTIPLLHIHRRAEKTDTIGGGSWSDTSVDFSESNALPSAASAPSSMSSASRGMSAEDMKKQQIMGMLQQEQQWQQQTMFLMKITDMAFDKCVSTPRAELNSSEHACIGGMLKKYTDAQTFVVKRYQSQVQKQQELR